MSIFMISIGVFSGILLVVILTVQHKHHAKMAGYKQRSPIDVASEVRRVASLFDVSDASETLDVGVRAWEKVADECGLRPELLRHTDSVGDLCPKSLPFLANPSLDSLETYLWSRQRSTNNETSNFRQSIETVAEFVAECMLLNSSSSHIDA